MKINKRKISMTFLLLIFTVLSAAALRYRSHPTYWKYCDSWVIGRSISEVEKRYGEFDLVNSYSDELKHGRTAYRIYHDGSGFLPDYLDHYYYMYYDENGMIYRVKDGCQPGG